MADAALRLWRTFAALALLPALAACGQSPPGGGPRLSHEIPPVSSVAGSATALVEFETSPFPFHGTAPGATKPFMNVEENGRLGHASGRNGVLWEDQTYSDRRVLLSVPRSFDPRRPAALVVFLHGNGATLERDVRDRQGVVRQLARSGLNAVLVAPQFALDAHDSSAGRFWEPGLFAAFLAEAGRHLADLTGTGDPAPFEAAPVLVVAYSGGYLPAAAAIRFGQAGERLRGVVLLDALYGEADTFRDYVEHRGTGFFVSLYGRSSRDGNARLKARLAEAGIGIDTALGDTIAPGSVTMVDAGDATAHGDFVTGALGGDPVALVLSRVAGFERRPGQGLVASQAVE